MADLKAQIRDQRLPPFERLCLLMALLRSEEGCSWDRAQDHKSLLPYLIEETYEVVESIESEKRSALREELGDLLCQVVFHAQLAAEEGQFDINDVAAGIVDKLIARHPHVFDQPADLEPGQVRDQWEKIKTSSGGNNSVLSGLPRSMPALTMAYRVGEKAGGIGFDWNSAGEVLDKVQEELDEVRRELAAADVNRRERLTSEIGDLLFAVASAARKLGIEPESALRQALKKFRDRFRKLEEQVRHAGGQFDEYTLDQLEEIWQRVKKDSGRS